MTDEEKRQKQREYSKAWYQRNKEQQAKKKREKYHADPEKTRKAANDYYHAHKKECLDRQRAYRRKVRGTPAGKEQMRQERLRRVNYHRDRSLKHKFNISLVEYEQILAQQNGVCAICGKQDLHKNRWGHTNNNLAVDHDHNTGKVRGLLCKRCNNGIGIFYESTQILERAIEYLKTHNSQGWSPNDPLRNHKPQTEKRKNATLFDGVP